MTTALLPNLHRVIPTEAIVRVHVGRFLVLVEYERFQDVVPTVLVNVCRSYHENENVARDHRDLLVGKQKMREEANLKKK